MNPLEKLYADREMMKEAMKGQDRPGAYVYPQIRDGKVRVMLKWFTQAEIVENKRVVDCIVERVNSDYYNK